MQENTYKDGRDKKILKTLQRTTLFLADLAARGAGNATAEDIRMLVNITEALRYWGLRKLAFIMGRLRRLVSAKRGDTGDEQAGRDISEKFTEAIFTCKAVKTYLRGRLDDHRIFEPLVGRKWKENELDIIEDIRLVKTCEDRFVLEGNTICTKNIFIDLDSGTLYRIDDITDPTDVPAKPPVIESPHPLDELVVSRALLSPDFPPQRLVLKDFFPEYLGPHSRQRILELAQGSFRVIVNQYKSFRSNLFAPPVFYTLLRFRQAYSTGRELYLVDCDNSMLRLADHKAGPELPRFRHHLVYGRFDCVFGRITLEGPDPVFLPLSIFRTKETPAFLFLTRDLAP